MKVRMKVQILGTRDGVRWPAVGGVVELSDHEAAKECAQGRAEPVAEPEKPERAVIKAPETRARKQGPDVDARP